MSPNSHPALSVAEVVESIFLQCDMKILLVSAQRVCRGWYAAAQTPAVQKHLFFKEDVRPSTPVRNPLLSEFFPYWFPVAQAASPSFTSDNLATLPAVQPGKIEAFKLKNASWRRMLIQQPPITSFTRWEETHSQMGVFLSTYSVPHDNEIDVTRRNRKSVLPEREESPPMRMEAFYKLVSEDREPVSNRLFVWRRTDGWESVVKKLAYSLGPDHFSILEEFLERDGLVFFQRQVMQCTSDNPWEIEKRFKL
ncbi:hypothetical protein HJFPF1_12283 [Paramyrothecium foliicola]|nr:hypothetical protein HJFPF1_12283 [Paramyrothecium foliicola]